MWYNALMIGVLRSPLHALLGSNMIVLTYTGRKTGQLHRVPVNFVRQGDVLFVTSQRDRVWWRNLRGGAVVSVRLAGSEREAFGEVLEDTASVAAALAIYLRGMPQAAKFFQVALDASGGPDPEALARAAEGRVVVKLKLAAGS